MAANHWGKATPAACDLCRCPISEEFFHFKSLYGPYMVAHARSEAEKHVRPGGAILRYVVGPRGFVLAGEPK